MEDLRFEPTVLRWAREKAFGLRMEALATKLESSWKVVTPETIKKWEDGILQPTFVEVQKLAEIYKRPLAVFFLDSPPEEAGGSPDLRTIESKDNEDISSKGLLIIRKARRTQAIAARLYEELQEKTSFKYPKYSITNDPDKLAEQIRIDLSISLQKQFQFRKFEDFFEYFRAKIENVGVITLKSGSHDSFPTEDFRALSFADIEPYVILVNNKDYEGAKTFSLAHEFGHVLLRKAGLCNNFKSFDSRGNKIDELEIFCNQFAASLLVPKEDLLNHRMLRKKKKIMSQDLDSVVEYLAFSFKVSRVVILRRLLALAFIDKTTYKEKVSVWDKEIIPSRKKGGRFSLKTVLQKNGIVFSSLVLEAYGQKKISYAGISDCLGLKRRYIPKFIDLLHAYGR